MSKQHIHIARYLLDVLAAVKMAHWFAHNYDTHKIIDDLYVELSGEFDGLMETLLSLKKVRAPVPKPVAKKNLAAVMDDLEYFLEATREKAARSDVDNALKSVSKYRYLLGLI